MAKHIFQLQHGACPLEKFLTLHVIYEIKSECILKSNHVGVALTLGIHLFCLF